MRPPSALGSKEGRPQTSRIFSTVVPLELVDHGTEESLACSSGVPVAGICLFLIKGFHKLNH